MLKSKKELLSIYVFSAIGVASLLIILFSDQDSWAKGFFIGVMVSTILGLPYFIYSYFREKKRENQSS